MHVSDLDGVSTLESGSKWRATITVTVVDVNGNAVSNATVSATWSGGLSGTASCTTAGNGQCSLVSNKLTSSETSVTLTVNSVTHAAHAYQAGDNADPDGDSNGTTITVSKP